MVRITSPKSGSPRFTLLAAVGGVGGGETSDCWTVAGGVDDTTPIASAGSPRTTDSSPSARFARRQPPRQRAGIIRIIRSSSPSSVERRATPAPTDGSRSPRGSPGTRSPTTRAGADAIAVEVRLGSAMRWARSSAFSRSQSSQAFSNAGRSTSGRLDVALLKFRDGQPRGLVVVACLRVPAPRRPPALQQQESASAPSSGSTG